LDFPRPSPPDGPRPVRLQKYLALCGLGSRRACELLIAGGRVAVNGQVVREQGRCVIPGTDRVLADGRPAAPETPLYILLHKPAGVVTTCRDPQRRRTFADLLPDFGARLFPVGRLDLDSEGLLILTNDGALGQRLTHPRHHVPKVYEVRVSGRLTEPQAAAMEQGIVSDGDTLRALKVTPAGAEGDAALYRVTLGEGHKRQIRRMFAHFGLTVHRLVRTRIGPIELGDLEPGAWRFLSPEEVAALRRQ
jgi:23S rRNA pseudouridine2605 synthase